MGPVRREGLSLGTRRWAALNGRLARRAAALRISPVCLRVVPLCTVLLGGPIDVLMTQERPPLERRKLTSITTVDGITCAPTGRAYAEFYPLGRLASCPLAYDTVVAGHPLPANTWLQLTEDGHLTSVWLPQDAMLAGHRCRGTGYRGWSVSFHPTGALAQCYLGEVAVIDGVPCQRGTLWTELRGGGNSSVHFREDGRLERCQAAYDFVRDGVEIRKWQVVQRDSAGQLRPR